MLGDTFCLDRASGIRISLDDFRSSLSPLYFCHARWLHESQPISNHPGFQTVQGGIESEDLRYRPRFFGVVEIWKDF